MTSSSTGEEVAIVGIYQDEYVATAKEFSEPIIGNCCCGYFNILTPEQVIENGFCLVSEKEVYQIEENVFKVSLYGTIHRGWILQKESEGSHLMRTTNEFQIVTKKFRKIDVENLSRADDPMQEFSALQSLEEEQQGKRGHPHPNVLGQIACLCDDDYYYSIMKYCDGGELCSQILGIGPMNELQGRRVFLQLLDALEFIQSKGIFHRDISLENVLLIKPTNQILLIDFGMCLQISLQDPTSAYASPSSSFSAGPVPYLLPPLPAKGKKSYMAPEIIAEATPFNGFKSDIWSLGILLFTMLTGKFIVTHASSLCPLFRHIRNGRLKEMCAHWRLGLSDEVQDLLYDMLSVDPKKRPTVAEIRNYSWCCLAEEGTSTGCGSVAAAGA
jgi:serine/threonine protein kinase